MRLRTRLIVAFLVLSVVPLGAVTYYSYTSQVRAMRDLATREADALSSEMTQRMQLVTTELSNRVEQLVDIEPAVLRVSQTTPAAVAPKPSQAALIQTAAPAVDLTALAVPALARATTMDQAEVADALS